MAKKCMEHCSYVEEDLEWLYRLNPALDELLEIIRRVPEEIKEGVLN